VGARRNSQNSRSWLQERKEILQKIKDQVRLYLGEESSELRIYANAYKSDIMRPWRPVDVQAVYDCLQQVSVVFGGDFHPFAQAQRAHLRIMRKLIGERPIILALECLFDGHQSHIDDYLNDKISEDEFLRRVSWERLWGFPWSHYRPIIEFAKSHGLRVVGINKLPQGEQEITLLERDQCAAQHTLSLCQSHPEALIYVLYGDLHIAQQHIPRALKDLAAGQQPQLDMATLYLNSEHIYFSLADAGQESKVDVVAYSDREFCLLSSPPWVKWQSYLMYLEENIDVGLEFEEDEEDDDEEDWDFQIDYTDHVSNLVHMICVGLELDLKRDAIAVYSLQDEQALRQAQKHLLAKEKTLAHELIKSDKGFYIPRAGFFYLSKATVNHAATLAGQYVHAQLSQRQHVTWDFPKDFLRCIWIEAMAFLLSKLVNPNRKSQTMADLKKELQAFDKQDRGREPLLLALDHKMSELLFIYAQKDKPITYRPREKSSYLLAANFIGEMLGERYFLLSQSQRIGITDIKDLLSVSLDSKDFDSFYYGELKRLDQLEVEGEAYQ
jgi:hypothetical protein